MTRNAGLRRFGQLLSNIFGSADLTPMAREQEPRSGCRTSHPNPERLICTTTTHEFGVIISHS
jgi:hypothetical protein